MKQFLLTFCFVLLLNLSFTFAEDQKLCAYTKVKNVGNDHYNFEWKIDGFWDFYDLYEMAPMDTNFNTHVRSFKSSPDIGIWNFKIVNFPPNEENNTPYLVLFLATFNKQYKNASSEYDLIFDLFKTTNSTRTLIGSKVSMILGKHSFDYPLKMADGKLTLVNTETGENTYAFEIYWTDFETKLKELKKRDEEDYKKYPLVLQFDLSTIKQEVENNPSAVSSC